MAHPLRMRWVTLLLALLAALPLAIAPVPLMSDLPNHVARHHVLAQSLFGAGNPHWQVAWRWVGNLGVDLPAVLLTPWLGAEQATRLIVLTIAPLTLLGLMALGRAAHGRVTPGVALALPFVFSQPWHYGFVNSCLSVALALFVAAAWLRRPIDGAVRAAGFALAALVVWSAHVMGWGVLLLLVAGAELADRDWRTVPRRALRAAPLLLPVAPLLAWRGGQAGPPFVFAPHPASEKMIDLATMLKGVSAPFDLAMLGALAMLGIVAVAAARRPRLDPRLVGGAILLGLAFVLMPTTLLGSWGADLRLAPVVAMIGLVAIGPARSDRVGKTLVVAGLTLFAVRALVIAASWNAAQSALAPRLALLDQVPKGGRLAYLIAAPNCHAPWTLDIDNKLGSLAVPRRDAFANTLFHIPGADLIAVRRADDAPWVDGTQDVACAKGRQGADRRLEAMADARFDVIWVADATTTPRPPAGYRLAARTARDTLFVRGGRDGLE